MNTDRSTVARTITARNARTVPPVSGPRDFPRQAAMVACARLARHPRTIRTTPTDLDELAASIRAEGVLQPLLVHSLLERRAGVADLEVIDGHRRLAAAEIAGLRRVPVIVRPHLTDDDALFAILGSALKADVDDQDKARAVATLNEEFDYTWSEIAARLQQPLATIQGWRHPRPRSRPGGAANRGSARPGSDGTRAPRIKPSVVHEMCARCDRHELTADQVIEALRAMLGDWHPAPATTAHPAHTTPPHPPQPTRPAPRPAPRGSHEGHHSHDKDDQREHYDDAGGRTATTTSERAARSMGGSVVRPT